MPAAYTPQQRNAIQQYVSFAKVKDSVAAKALKAANWDINTALNEHLNKGPKASNANLAPVINAVFDQYRDAPDDNPNTIGVEGTMGYLQAIGVTLEEPASVAIHHLASAESMGELERDKFVQGWKERGLPGIKGDSGNGVEAMRTAAEGMRVSLVSDREYFKSVYKHAFLLARAPGQKSAQLDTAVELWRLMFSEGQQGALVWKTDGVDWLALWLGFIESKGPKVVSRDLWNQTEAFARKSMEDETLGFRSEEASWPTVIDEFVGYIKEKGTAMDVE